MKHERVLTRDDGTRAMTTVEVATFGAAESPETDAIDVGLGQDFQCPCGCVMNLGGAWLAAHWTEKLQRTCENCGQLFLIRSGRVKLSRKVGPYGSPKHVWGT